MSRRAAQIERCAPFARDLLVFVPSAPDQEALVERERAALAGARHRCLRPEDLFAELDHVAYSEGESYGYLHVVPDRRGARHATARATWWSSRARPTTSRWSRG